jgi:hypothetical protein
MIHCPKQPKGIDSEKHRRFVAQHRCVICTAGELVFVGHTVSQCAHVRIGFYTKGKRPCDSRTTPICPDHHMNSNGSQHDMSEKLFWEKHWLDPFQIAEQLSAISPDKRIRKTTL